MVRGSGPRCSEGTSPHLQQCADPYPNAILSQNSDPGILIYIYANGDPEWTKEMSKDINNGHTLIPFNHLQEDMKHQYALQSYTEYMHWTNDIGYSYGNYFNYGGVHALD